MEWLQFDLAEKFYVTCIPIPFERHGMAISGGEAWGGGCTTWLMILETPRNIAGWMPAQVVATEELSSLSSPRCLATAFGCVLRGYEELHSFVELWLEVAAPVFDRILLGGAGVA